MIDVLRVLAILLVLVVFVGAWTWLSLEAYDRFKRWLGDRWDIPEDRR